MQHCSALWNPLERSHLYRMEFIMRSLGHVHSGVGLRCGFMRLRPPMCARLTTRCTPHPFRIKSLVHPLGRHIINRTRRDIWIHKRITLVLPQASLTSSCHCPQQTAHPRHTQLVSHTAPSNVDSSFAPSTLLDSIGGRRFNRTRWRRRRHRARLGWTKSDRRGALPW